MDTPDTIEGRGNRALPPEERFWKRVEQINGCWLWHGGRERTGPVGPPGRLVIDDRQIGVRRFSYELRYGEIPAGKHLLVTCNNPWCIRPEHLSLANATQGHHPGSTRCPNAKLTKEQVSAIRTLATKGKSRGAIADEFGVSRVQIWRIVTGRAWKS